MNKRQAALCLWLILILTLSFSSATTRTASASPGRLIWDVFNTPSDEGKVIFSPSEINALVIGSNGTTFYALDIPGDPSTGTYPDGKIYKTTNAGITWTDIPTKNLIAAGANMPAWDIAIAPEDPNLIAVVTDSRQKVYLSIDGGNNWADTSVPSLGTLLIADIAISPLYNVAFRDIAIGVRDPDGTSDGKVYLRQYPTVTAWYENDLGEDVTSLSFSPNYDTDLTLLTIASDTNNTYLHFGRQLMTTTPEWDWLASFPITLDSVAENEIITSDIEIPSDYNSGNHGTGTPPKIYVSYDFNDGTRKGKIRRIDDTLPYFITPAGMGSNGVSAIAYYGSVDSGKLFAAEAKTDAAIGKVKIWRTFNPQVAPPSLPTWDLPSNLKQPTGGAISGYANAQIAFSPNGGTVYCGTATAIVDSAADWDTPANWTTGAYWDESAFSVSSDNAYVWNQISLIDTGLIDPTTPATNNIFLTDVAATTDSRTLYLSSVNKNPNYFDSIWRTTSDPLGRTWERVLCFKTSSDADEIILRLDPRVDDTKSIFFAIPGTQALWYSRDQGQLWYDTHPPAPVTDFTLASETTIYFLDNVRVHRGTAKAGVGAWIWKEKVDTCLNAGHTITTPLKNPKDQEWVIVGSAADGRVAYADFLAKKIEFKRTIAVPISGNTHVLCDDKFHDNKTIYAATDHTDGKIYRWVLDVSDKWQDLEPINRGFYGLAQQVNVLYGAWQDALTATNTGVDRTLYPTAVVPPPLEWDDLTVGLPESGDANYPVQFTREPSSLKTSSNTDILLWAIDDRDYNFTTKQGCLWTYTDIAAVVGPWTLSPAQGESIPVDPVTGRSTEVNFRWQQFPETRKYEFWLAKDDGFTLSLIKEVFTPFDLEGPAYILPPGILEVNHTYYWKVRAREAVTGEEIRSPWSATMFFHTMAGLPVTSPYIGPMPLSPTKGDRNIPVRGTTFSWTTFRGTSEYYLQLSETPDMLKIIADVKVPTTAYTYDKELKYSTQYYWQVRANKPMPSDWSPVFSFMTEAKPKAPAVTEPAQPPAQPTPLWVWFLIAIVTLLYLTLIVYITTKPRYVSPREDKTMMSDTVIGERNPLTRLKNAIAMGFKRSRYL